MRLGPRGFRHILRRQTDWHCYNDHIGRGSGLDRHDARRAGTSRPRTWQVAYAHGPGLLRTQRYRRGQTRCNSCWPKPSPGCVRAVNIGDILLHCLPNRLFATIRRVRAVAQPVSTTARPVRQALVEMGSSGYAVSAPRRARRESPGIV